jgi:hypothetical protein
MKRNIQARIGCPCGLDDEIGGNVEILQLDAEMAEPARQPDVQHTMRADAYRFGIEQGNRCGRVTIQE